MLNFSEAKSINFDDKDLLQNYLRQLNSPSCEMSFANLKMWSEVYGTKQLKIGNEYLFFAENDNLIYFPHWQNLSVETLCTIAAEFQKFYRSESVIFYDVDPFFVENHAEIRNFFEIEIVEDDFDYLYLNEQLSSMSGAILKKKRNLINQFEKNYPNYYIEKLNKDNSDKCYRLALQLNNALEQTEFVGEENLSMAYAFRNLEALDLQGFILYADKELPVGFSVYSFLNNSYADIHFEKARHDIKGAPQILVQLLANEILKSNTKFMNREQDLGNSGIRYAKKSLNPCDFYRRVKLKFLG